MAMRDQAYELRELVRRAYRVGMPSPGPAPRLLVLMGGQARVGTTTMAVNLAAAFSQHGCRVVLVDADLERPRIAALCGIEARLGIVDILSAQRNIHEVLEPGPAGLQVVAGGGLRHPLAQCTEVAQQRIIGQLETLGRHTDFVILDIGSGIRPWTGRFWSAAEQVCMVTTVDSDCVMDTYATMKILRDDVSPLPQIFTVVNRPSGDGAAADIHRRLENSCRRFLSLEIQAAGQVPLDDGLPRAANEGVPASIQSPTSPAARAIDRIASMLLARPAVPRDLRHQAPAA